MRTFVVNIIVTAWQGDLTTAFSERREKVNFTDLHYVRQVWNKSVYHDYSMCSQSSSMKC